MDRATPPPFQLQVLGDPSLRDSSGNTPPSLGWGKPLALLCLLAVRGEARRDEVVDLLWRGVDEDRARNAFRQALHRLRGAIGDDLLPQDRERLRLVRSDRLAIDLGRFEAAANAGRLDEAIELYRGDFLANATLDEPPFDMWVEQERTRIRARFRKVLEDAVAHATAAGRWSEAITHVRRLVAAAPFESNAAQLAATTLVSAGRRAEARDLLQRFAATLQSELGIPMPAELQSLLGRIERQHDKQTEPAPAAAGAAAPIGALPFVGREAELSRLVTLCRTSGEDAGGFALVEGESAIGKTRLVRELVSHVRSLGRVTVLNGHERATGAALAYGVFAEALRPLVRTPGVVGASRHLLAEAARLLPELRDKIDLPAVTDVEDDAARLRFFEGVAALIDAAAFEQPIVIALEDLQHISPSSLDLLSYLCARLAGSGVTFVATVRPAEAPAAVLSRLRALGAASAVGAPPHGSRALRFVLEPLAAADAHRAGSAVAQPAGISATSVDRAVQRAEGNPGRLVEMLRRAAGGDDIAALPVDVRSLIADRIQRASSSQRRVVFVLGLIGRPVPAALAAAAAHLPEPAADEALDALAASGLAEIDGGLVATSELTAAVALDVAGEATRAFLAGWIARALEASPGSHPAELARLYAIAGDARPAFEHSRRAAFGALAMGAVAEAVQLFHSARAFAGSPQQQSEIESYLTALGSGLRQITPSAGSIRIEERASAPAGAPSRAPATEGPARPWERLFPNWRALLGAAVATLVLSAVVLALRPPTIQTGARGGDPDTLVVSDGESGRTIRLATGDITRGFNLSERRQAPPSEPAWLDSIVRPWINPVANPRNGSIAIARVTAFGSEVFVISSDRRDTVRLAGGASVAGANEGDARPLGWSPDGRWVLAAVSRTLPDGSFDTDLYAFAVEGRDVLRRAVDTTARRAITEAAWSPDGSRLAWVARVGHERQLEVFASDADGSAVSNVSRHPADDQHIAWSPSGDLLAFTSSRDGNAELYAYSLREGRLWRLTFDAAQDDGAAFSRDGRLLAFESTRGGTVGVYVMTALGGDAIRVGQQQRLTVNRWLLDRRYVDRVRVVGSDRLRPGDTVAVSLAAFDHLDEPIGTRAPHWTVLDSSVARIVQAGADATSDTTYLIARRPGLARVVATLGEWRSDTAFVHVGDAPLPLLGSGSSAAWRPLGVPAPLVDRNGSILLRADREWDSGVLSESPVPLLPGLTLSATLDLPLGAALDAAATAAISLVATEDQTSVDRLAPQFLRLATFSWNADAERFVYAVGREVFTEPPADAATASPVPVRLRVESDSTVTFTVAGRQRWRSTLRLLGAHNGSSVQVWIAGRATGDRVRVSDVQLILATPNGIANP